MMKESMYTPFCKCKWAFLQVPKPAEGKFKSAFQITLVLDKTEHAELLRQLSDLNKAAKGPDKVNDPGHPIKGDWKWVGEGESKRKEYIQDKFLVRFKTNAEFTDHIVTFDSQG